MRNPISKSVTAGLSIVVLLLLVACAKLYWDDRVLWFRTAMANEQIEVFDAMRKQASQSNPADAAGSLSYVVAYYPSGTKQIPGSQLDLLVERERTEAVQAIIAELRTKTGEDLGNDPETWIDRYTKK